MYFLSVKDKFEAAHFLSGYRGECANMHGHSWKVEAVFSGGKLDRMGMLIDPVILRRTVRKVVGQFDHRCVNSIFQSRVEDTESNPTPENIANWIFDSLEKAVKDMPIQVQTVIVWESEDGWASVTK